MHTSASHRHSAPALLEAPGTQRHRIRRTQTPQPAGSGAPEPARMGCTVSPEPKPSLVLARRVHSGQLGVTAGSVPVSLFRYTCRGGRAVGRAARAGGGRRWGARWRSRARARAVPGGQPAPPSAAPYPAWALRPVLVWHAGSPPPVQARIHMHVRMSVSRLHTGVAPPADLPASQAPRHGLRAQALAQTGSAVGTQGAAACSAPP